MTSKEGLLTPSSESFFPQPLWVAAACHRGIFVQLAFPKYTPDTIKWPYVQNASPFSKHDFGVPKCSFLGFVFFIVEVCFHWLANNFRPGTIPSTWSRWKCGAQRSTVFWSEKDGNHLWKRWELVYDPYLVKKRFVFIMILCVCVSVHEWDGYLSDMLK